MHSHYKEAEAEHAFLHHAYTLNEICEEKHSNTTAHHPVVKPPATASTAV